MKAAPLFLAGSLAVNAALVVAFAWHPSLSPPIFRNFFVRNFHAADESAQAKPATTKPAAAAGSASLWASLQTDDLPTLVARLRAAGFPADVIREVLRTRVNARYNARLSALMEPDPNTPYWKTSAYEIGDAKRREEINQLQRERAKALRDLLKDDVFATGDVTAAQRRQFGNLSRAKIDLVQRVEDDYQELFSQVRAAMNGVTLPEDREKLALLTREKQTDLAALLTPEELADYTMRTSPITNLLRTRLSNFDPTESEFRAIFQEQQALNDKFPTNISGGIISGTDFEARRTAQQELEKALKADLGDARYAEYTRATSNDFQQLSRLAQRDNLPAETAIQAYNVRDKLAQASNQIFDDASLSPDQKRAALQTLAQDTRAQLLAMLGPTSGPAYVKIADQVLKQVEQGSAVSFTNSGGGMISMSSSSGAPVMVSVGGSSATYRRLPGYRPPGMPAAPTPRG